MRTALSCLALLGFSIALNGQIAGAPIQSSEPAATLQAKQLQSQTTATTLPDGRHAVGMHVVATGGVEIHIGSHVITADEAVIRRIPTTGDEVELRGDVRLKGRVAVK